MADYLADYTYTTKGEEPKNDKAICYSNLFCRVMRSSSIIESININMYENSGADQHKLSFDKEDIEYVFSKLSHIIDPPLVEEKKLHKNGKHIQLGFKFNDNSNAFIKTICTLCRYFYEIPVLCDKSYVKIMKSSINYSKTNPDLPFIEILQFMHYDVDCGGGHSLVNINSRCKLAAITSDKTFTKNMKDASRLNVYSNSSNMNINLAIFNGNGVIKMTELEKDYLTTFKQYTRI